MAREELYPDVALQIHCNGLINVSIADRIAVVVFWSTALAYHIKSKLELI